MAITVNPARPGSPYLQCLPRTAFSKRVFFPATLTAHYEQRENAQLTCAEKLLEAETAYHALSLGQQVQYLSHEGRAVTYTPANSDQLYRYLLRLRAECGAQQAGHVGGCGCSACCGHGARSKGRARGVVTY